jgi:hypothetical protein
MVTVPRRGSLHFSCLRMLRRDLRSSQLTGGPAAMSCAGMDAQVDVALHTLVQTAPPDLYYHVQVVDKFLWKPWAEPHDAQFTMMLMVRRPLVRRSWSCAAVRTASSVSCVIRAARHDHRCPDITSQALLGRIYMLLHAIPCVASSQPSLSRAASRPLLSQPASLLCLAMPALPNLAYPVPHYLRDTPHACCAVLAGHRTVHRQHVALPHGAAPLPRHHGLPRL